VAQPLRHQLCAAARAKLALGDPQRLLERRDLLPRDVGGAAKKEHSVEGLNGLVSELMTSLLERVLRADLPGPRHLDQCSGAGFVEPAR